MNTRILAPLHTLDRVHVVSFIYVILYFHKVSKSRSGKVGQYEYLFMEIIWFCHRDVINYFVASL